MLISVTLKKVEGCIQKQFGSYYHICWRQCITAWLYYNLCALKNRFEKKYVRTELTVGASYKTSTVSLVIDECEKTKQLKETLKIYDSSTLSRCSEKKRRHFVRSTIWIIRSLSGTYCLHFEFKHWWLHIITDIRGCCEWNLVETKMSFIFKTSNKSFK